MSYAQVANGFLAGVSVPPEAESFFEALRRFALNPTARSYDFPPSLSRRERSLVHALARKFDFGHRSLKFRATSAREEEEDQPDTAKIVRVWKKKPRLQSHDVDAATPAVRVTKPDVLPLPPPERDWDARHLRIYDQLADFLELSHGYGLAVGCA